MFGTMVIQLLSEFTGGELIVRHGGKEKRFKFDGLEGCINYHYIAFYADCQHELTEVISGYRLCLVYNLVCSEPGSTLTPADNQDTIRTIVESIKEWDKEASESTVPDAMVYLMEHMYTRASLSFDSLKSVDRAVGDVLIEAQRQVDFDLFLAHINVTQNYSATYFDGCYETDQLIEEKTKATFFVAPTGDDRLLPKGSICLDKDIIHPKKLFDLDSSADEEECEEATGNAGATVDRFYHWTAVIFWPIENRLKMIGLNRLTEKLKEMIGDEEGELSTSKHEKCLKLAQAIIFEIISQSNTHSRCIREFTTDSSTTLLQCLLTLGDVSLIQQFAKCDVSYIDSSVILSLCKHLSVNDVEPILLRIIEKGDHLNNCCILFGKLFEYVHTSRSSSEFLALCKRLVPLFFKSLSSNSSCYLSTCSVKTLLQALQVEPSLLSEFLTLIASRVNIDTLIGDMGFAELIVSISQVCGWKCLAHGLTNLFTKCCKNNDDIPLFCNFLTHLVPASLSITVDEEQRYVCEALFNTVVQVILA